MRRKVFAIAVVSLGLGAGVGACADGDDREPTSDAVPAAEARIEVSFTGDGTSYVGDRNILEGSANLTFHNDSADDASLAVLRFDTDSEELAEELAFIPEGSSEMPGDRMPASFEFLEEYPPGSHSATIELRTGAYLVDVAATGPADSTVVWRAAMIEVEGGDTAADRVARATDLVDIWHEGVNAVDVEMVTSIFAPDGVILDQAGEIVVGSWEELARAIREADGSADYRRVSEVTELRRGTYTFVQQFIDQTGDTVRAVVVFDVDDRLVTSVQWVSEFYDLDSSNLPVRRERTADLITPSGRVVPTFNAEPEHLALVGWAMARYLDAGLVEPPVMELVFPPSDQCERASGFTVHEPDGIAVHVCLTASEVCADTDCASFDLAARRTVLHELSHVWETVALDPPTRAAFLELRGLDHWFDDPLWGYRGTEQTAEIMAWGLLDQPTRPVKLPDQRSCTELLDAYRLLTGTEPQRADVCVP
jgi:ketosteroid isomerase-like protein